jgi:uncharacterized membrane protein YgcG
MLLAPVGAVLVAVLLVMCSTPAIAQREPHNAPAGRPDPVPTFYNATDLFSDKELSVLEQDAFRLTRINIPTVVYVQIADSEFADERSTQQFADTVRDKWDIASAPGADDGLVMLITLDKQGEHGHSLSLSYGEATFQHSGLTPEYIQDVFEHQMLPRLKDGRYYEALYTGMRRVRYGGIYLPPPVPPLEGSAQTVHTNLNWIAPISVIAVSAMFITLSLRMTMDAPRRRSLIRMIGAAVGIWIVAIAILSVYGRSSIGIASALLIALSLAIQLWIWTRPHTERRPGVRGRAVPPASRHVRKLQQAKRMTPGIPSGVWR